MRSLILPSPGSTMSLLLSAMVLASCLSTHSVHAQARSRTAATQTLSGIEALRYLHARRNFAKAEQYAYGILWENIRQPEALWLLADALYKQKKLEDAAAFLTILLQVWDEDGFPGDQTASKQQAEKVLISLNKQFEGEKAAYAQQAPGKQFVSPQKVDDLWMTEVIAEPQSATTAASGLSVTGRYAFTVTISDGTNEVKRDVLLNVYEGNQPPTLSDVHNRLPVTVTLPDSATELRGGGFDLEGDKLAFRWSVVSQPPGSVVRLESPDQPKCRVSKITKPGDHVFRFEASDGVNTVAEQLTVPAYPVNSAPVIHTVQAAPAMLTPPQDATFLSATTSDLDGDIISHWWRAKRSPAGVKLAFTKQGSRDTKVSGLTAEGTYVFELTVVDRTKFVTKDVVVTVAVKGPAT